MPEPRGAAPSVVVGIDGSRWAVEAACWAVDEAVRRDIAMRLVYAVGTGVGCDGDAQYITRQFATAQTALRCASAAIESTGKPVKIEAEIVQQQPVAALLVASSDAAMVCVGAIGLSHFRAGHLGSTAGALAASARCPVAVVRGHVPVRSPQRSVVVELDGPTGDHVLRHGFDEARTRGAPLQALSVWQSRRPDINEDHAVTTGDRDATAAMQRRLRRWRNSYPEVTVTTAAVHGNPLSYFVAHGDSIQLLVVGHERRRGVGELLGAAGNAMVQHVDCSVLICGPQTLL